VLDFSELKGDFMRMKFIVAPLLICASPAFAQPAPQAPPPVADPAVADRLANSVQAISDALLNIPVGDLKAAAEGRRATPDEKRVTVGDLARRDDPDFDRKLHRQIAEARPMVRQSIRAVNESLPAVMQSLDQARRSLERALANLPDPTYPQR
jgi:hypothetical protein